MRKTALSSDPMGVFQKVMGDVNRNDSPSDVVAHTEATVCLVFRMANNSGHFALNQDDFMDWNEATFAEKWLANLENRRNDQFRAGKSNAVCS